MSFDVTDNLDSKTVEVELHGVLTLDQLERALRVTVFYLKAYDWDRVVVDLRHSLSVLTRKEMKSFVAGKGPGLERHWRIALLVGGSQKTMMAEAEEIGQRLGINLAVFANEAMSTAWLNQPNPRYENHHTYPFSAEHDFRVEGDTFSGQNLIRH